MYFVNSCHASVRKMPLYSHHFIQVEKIYDTLKRQSDRVLVIIPAAYTESVGGRVPNSSRCAQYMFFFKFFVFLPIRSVSCVNCRDEFFYITLGVELSCESMRIHCPNCISPTICIFDIITDTTSPAAAPTKTACSRESPTATW